MTSDSLLAFAATLLSGVLALVAPIRNHRSLASWCFFAGMATLAIESALGGISLSESDPEKVAYSQSLVLITKSFLPGFWLTFSLVYCRGNHMEFLKTWKFFLAAAFLLPIGIAIGCSTELVNLVTPSDADPTSGLRFGNAGRTVNILCLVAVVLILNNLEKTFRSTVGGMRWRIKFVVLGLAVIFAGMIYTLSQDLLFSHYDLRPTDIETAALLVGCAMITVAYLRNGMAEIDVYPSRSILQGTVTVLLAGGYLFVIGLLAQLIALLGGVGNSKAQAFFVLLAVALLAVLLVSERVRQKIRYLVSRNFKRPQHDFRKVWLLFTQRTSGVLDPDAFCATATKLISETLNVLSVTIWRVDERRRMLVFGASTAVTLRENKPALPLGEAIPPEPRKFSQPFNLEKEKEEWTENLKRISATQFRKGGSRICLPLSTGERWIGCAILADRVNGLPYSIEELDLLKCMGDQMAAGLSKLRLTEELMLAKELEAFQTMSAFFVHDLKNAASSLGLTLQNLRVHFDDLEFREDALRGIANTVDRIKTQIDRLSAVRKKLELKFIESDLNQLVIESLENLDGVPGVEVIRDLHPLPQVVIDCEQFRNVVKNLLLNALEAVGSNGQIRVETSQCEGTAVLSVADNGCGMSPEFVRNSLFRPFQTTKKKGLGIGMFQSKIIVEAHHGNIQVESEPGKGTRFGVYLPLAASLDKRVES